MRLILFLSLFLASLVSQASSNLIDSLQTLLKTNIADTTRVNSLNALANLYIDSYPDTMLMYGEKALALANKSKWQRGIGNAHFVIGNSYYTKGDFEQCLVYWKHTLEARKKEGVPKRTSAALSNIGLVYKIQSDYQKSLEYYLSALKIDREIGNSNGIVIRLGSIGSIYRNQGDYPKALEYNFEALKMSKELGIRDDVADNYIRIGSVYHEQGDFPMALENYFEGQKIYEELGMKRRIGLGLGNIGLIYFEMGDYPKALKYHLEALKMDKEVNRKKGIAVNFGNIGDVYSVQGDYPKALEYYLEYLRMSREMGVKLYQAIAYGNIGSLYTKTGRFSEAEKYLDSSLVLCDEVGATNIKRQFEEVSANHYDTTAYLAFQSGNYKEAAQRYERALSHDRLYSSAKDSLFNEGKSKDIGRIEQRHETEMSDLKRQQQEDKLARQVAENLQRRNILQYTGILIGIMVLFGLVLLLGRINIPISVAEGIVFILFLIIFEFLLVLTDPHVGKWTNEAPAWKLLVNAGLAMIIFPLHSFFERLLKIRLFKGGVRVESGSGPSKTMLVFFLAALSVVHMSFDNKTDSLIRELGKAEINDTTRINALNNLSRQYLFSNPDTAYLLASQALKISNKIKNSRTIASSYIGIANTFWIRGEYPKALANYREALKIFKALNNKAGIASALSGIGLIYRSQSNYSAALKYYFEALEIDKELGNKEGIARHLGRIGVVYRNQGDYPAALKSYFDYLEMAKETGNKRDQAIALGNIGNVYHNQSNYTAALNHYAEALEIGKELGDKQRIAIQLGNMGIIYHKKGDYNTALKYYLEALEIDKELARKGSVSIRLGNIGTIYANKAENEKDEIKKMKLIDEALNHYFMALEVSREMGNKKGVAVNLGNIGTVYTKAGRFAKAEQYLDSALAIDTAIGALHHTMEDYGLLGILNDSIASVAFQSGNYKEAAFRYKLALSYNRIHSSTKDSLFNEEKSKDIGRLEQKHEFELAEVERKQEEIEQSRLETERIGRRNTLQYTGILIGIVVLFGIVLLLGRINIPVRIAEGIVFILFLIIFEFLLVLTDPYVDVWTNEAPAWKLLINAGLAGLIFPVHQFFENRLKSRIAK